MMKNISALEKKSVELLDKVANLAHEEWEKWSKELVEKEKLSKKRIEDWKKLWVEYSKLSEKEKNKDRIWAKKFLELLQDKKEEKPKKKIIKKSYISKLDTSSKGATRNGFGVGLFEAGKKSKQVVALCADLTDSVKVTKFKEKFPTRFFEMGICEQNMMGAAAGMCLNGKIPFVTSYAAFNPGRNWDQLRVSVCYSNHNVKILGGHAGLTTGPDGATHQALEDIAITRVIPNLVVLVPCDEEETRKATLAAASYKGPVYLRVSREKCLNITSKTDSFEIGKANVLDEGEDVTIVACGLGVQFALEAREKLKEQGISASVLNMHTIKPLDVKTLVKHAKKTGAVVSVEEHQIQGGLGSAISESLSQEYPVPQEFVGVNDTFGESGEGYDLLEKYGVSTKEIVKKVKKVIKRKRI